MSRDLSLILFDSGMQPRSHRKNTVHFLQCCGQSPGLRKGLIAKRWKDFTRKKFHHFLQSGNFRIDEFQLGDVYPRGGVQLEFFHELSRTADEAPLHASIHRSKVTGKAFGRVRFRGSTLRVYRGKHFMHDQGSLCAIPRAELLIYLRYPFPDFTRSQIGRNTPVPQFRDPPQGPRADSSLATPDQYFQVSLCWLWKHLNFPEICKCARKGRKIFSPDLFQRGNVFVSNFSPLMIVDPDR